MYYHLIDPFYAFAQVRHCCHENTIVVFEGDVVLSLPSETGKYNLTDLSVSRFRPSCALLSGLLSAAYFTIDSENFFTQDLQVSRPVKMIRRVVRMIRQTFGGSRDRQGPASMPTSPMVRIDASGIGRRSGWTDTTRDGNELTRPYGFGTDGRDELVDRL